MDKALFKQLIQIVPSVDFKNQLIMNDFEAAKDCVSCIFDEFDPFLDEFSLFDEIYYDLQNDNFDNLVIILEKAKILFMLDLITTILDYLATDLRNLTKENKKAKDDLYIQSRFLLTYVDNLDEDFADKVIIEMKELIKSPNENIKMIDIMVIESLKNDHDLLASCLEELIHSNELTYHDLMLSIVNKDLKDFIKQFQLVTFLRKKYCEITSVDVLKLEYEISKYENIGLND